jgi:hypothetical protein
MQPMVKITQLGLQITMKMGYKSQRNELSTATTTGSTKILNKTTLQPNNMSLAK